MSARETFRALQAFQKRTSEIDQILKAREALAVIEYLNDYTNSRDYGENLKGRTQEELINLISKHVDSRPGYSKKYHVLNEGAVVLLSAYLEEFIEDLYAEAMRQLLDEKVKSAHVLTSLLEYVQWQFDNPTPDRISGLFGTCGIKDIVSNPKIERGKVSELVRIRNQIAHGEEVPNLTGRYVERLFKSIQAFADALNHVVSIEIEALKSGTTAKLN